MRPIARTAAHTRSDRRRLWSDVVDEAQPRPLALRQWQALPDEPRERIRTLALGNQRAQAAALWRQHVGGELRACLDAVDVLKMLL